MMSIKAKNAGLAPSHPGLTAEEIDVSRLIQGDIPLAERPFHLVAQERVLRSLEEFKKNSMEYF